jgi:hypothetical protein
MITSIVTTVVVWTLIRIVQFVSQLWTLANAAGSPRIRFIAAA